MDAILDLTSRAVSMIVLIQDSLLRLKSKGLTKKNPYSDNTTLFEDFIQSKDALLKLNYFVNNGVKITWVSIEPPPADEGPKEYCYQRC